MSDPYEVLLARAYGLHAHGHIDEASKLAVFLAEDLLQSPPNLMLDLPQSLKVGSEALFWGLFAVILFIENYFLLFYLLKIIFYYSIN